MDLNLTFMQTPGSGSDPRAWIGWCFYKHANPYDWFLRLVIPRGRWGYLSLHFLREDLYQGRKLFARYFISYQFVLSKPFSSQFILVQDSPVFDMDYVSGSVVEEVLTSVLEERFPEIESLTEYQKKALHAVINHKDVFAILPTGHGLSHGLSTSVKFFPILTKLG